MNRSTTLRAAPSVISFIGGVGIGATVTYLLDPQSGADRRHCVSQAALDAAHNAGDMLENTWHHASDAAHRATAALHSAGHEAVDHGHDAGRSLAASLHDLRPAARRLYARAMPTFQHRHDLRHEVVKDALLITAAAALGAGLMMLLDPSEGRRRRAAIRDKVSHGIEETSRLARNTSRYIAEKAHVLHNPEEAADEDRVSQARI
jgi:gas vesicle protein